MKVTFFINYLNHHQLPVADEMYKILGDDFHFVATYPRNPEELKGGFDYSDRPYCLLAAELKEDCQKAHQLNIESDVCVFGAGNLDWERERATTDKLSFEISERWFKRGLINILSPRLIKWWWVYQTRLRNKPFYKLCASAFTASDCRKLLTYRDRCFKWGYFTKIPKFEFNKPVNETPRIMWCGRLIYWKHPGHAILVAQRLKLDGYRFYIEVYGGGELKSFIEKLITELSLTNCVKLMDNVSNEHVLMAMDKSDIFLLTSDRNEGWGAVANEAMASGCCVVGSDAIGSVPFLIKDGYNGMIYRDGDVDSLYNKVKYLLDNPDICRSMGEKAASDLRNIWSPDRAANNLLKLISEIQSNVGTSILEGPCSVAK